jgi:hypothetical protein
LSRRTGINAFFPGIYACFPGKYANNFWLQNAQSAKMPKVVQLRSFGENRSKSINLSNEHLFVLFRGCRTNIIYTTYALFIDVIVHISLIVYLFIYSFIYSFSRSIFIYLFMHLFVSLFIFNSILLRRSIRKRSTMVHWTHPMMARHLPGHVQASGCKGTKRWLWYLKIMGNLWEDDGKIPSIHWFIIILSQSHLPVLRETMEQTLDSTEFSHPDGRIPPVCV